MSSRRSVACYAIALFSGGFGFSAPIQNPVAVTDAPLQIEAGKRIYGATCANCHGAGGTGSLGPALVSKGLSLEAIREAISNGRVGSAMPQFKRDLDAVSLAAVFAYVQWLETDGRLPQSLIKTEEEISDVDAAYSRPVAVGRDRGVPARGAELFFDPTRVCSCRTCHSYAGRGGPVGPDLASLHKSPELIYHSIVGQPLVTPDFSAILLNLEDGKSIAGIASEESKSLVAIYDVSSCPPVKRTIARAEIRNVSKVDKSGIYDHKALPYSKQDLIDLSAYLGRLPKQ